MHKNIDHTQYTHLNGSVSNAFNRGGIAPTQARRFQKSPAALEFLEWFQGSQVCNRQGYPVIQYHGMRTDLGESHFIPYSHFGNINVGNAFAGYNRHEPKKVATERGGVVYPVVLNIKKPLGLPDIKMHQIWKIADMLRDFKIISEQEHEWIGAGGRIKKKHPVCKQPQHVKYLSKEYPVMHYIQYKLQDASDHFHMADRMTKVLAKKGYDGIAYTNMYEFAGSISWIAFDPASQIRPAFGAASLGIPLGRGRDLKMHNTADLSYDEVDSYIDNGLETTDKAFAKYYAKNNI